MENYIECRVVLGLLCLIHVFANYGSLIPWGHIKKSTLNSFILTELIIVSAYIMCDILQTPPRDGWFIAILGYIFVYAMILLTWLLYSIFTLLEKDKIYEMTITHRVAFMNGDYFKGTVVEGEREYTVILPYSLKLLPLAEANMTQKVKFNTVIRGRYIMVKPA